MITWLFEAMLKALAITEGKSKGRRSPVGVAKTLHLLAPKFFPLWDEEIAKAYGCKYSLHAPRKYFAFMQLQKSVIDQLRDAIGVSCR